MTLFIVFDRLYGWKPCGNGLIDLYSVIFLFCDDRINDLLSKPG